MYTIAQLLWSRHHEVVWQCFNPLLTRAILMWICENHQPTTISQLLSQLMRIVFR